MEKRRAVIDRKKEQKGKSLHSPEISTLERKKGEVLIWDLGAAAASVAHHSTPHHRLSLYLSVFA
jgi:hypothetical protein